MKEQHVGPWIVKGEKVAYDNPWIRVTEYDVINPAGGNGIYGKVHFKNAAIGIVVLDEDMNTYLVGQHRFVLNAYSWEIPEGGCADTEESYLSAAQRELLEETGLTAHRWTEILRFHLSNSVTDEFGVIYLATGLLQGEAIPEETEDLQIKKTPFSEVVEMIEEGSITDAITIMAVQKIQIMLLTGQI